MTKYIDLCDTCINRIPSKPVRQPVINAYGYATRKSKLVMIKLCRKQTRAVKLLIASCKDYQNRRLQDFG